MDTDLFLRYLRDHTIEEGRSYIQEHLADLSDSKATGELLADEALRVLYTPFLSLKIAELLIFYGELKGHRSSYALGLKAKGDVLFQIEHHQAALEYLDAAGAEFLSLGDEGNWARSRISWVLSAGWLGRVEDALRAGDQARNVFLRLGEYYWVAVIDNNIAWVLDNIGRYQEALSLYENMLEIYSAVNDQDETFITRSIAIAKVNQGRLLAWLGKFDRAYELQEEAQASFRLLDEKDLIVEVEINLAELDYTQGYYGSALRRYYQARESLLQSDRSNSLILAELKLAMANCLVKLNRAQEASKLAEEAVKTYRESSMSLTTGNALRDYATTLAASGRLQESLAILTEAWNLFSSGGFTPFAFLTQLQQAELLLEMRSLDEAYNLAYLVKEYCDTHGLVARSVRASMVMVSALIENAQQPRVRREKGQQASFLQEATLLCKQTLLQARQHNLQEEIYKSYYLLGKIFASQDHLTRAGRYYKAAIAQIDRILDDLVYDLSPSFLHTTRMVYEDMIALCLRQSQAELAFCYLERARSVALRQHLNRSKNLLNEKERQRDISSTTMLRAQYELRDWQQRHRYYSVLLTDIDNSFSSTLDKGIILDEIKQCEVKLSELFERMHLDIGSTQSQFSTSHSTKNSKRNALQVERIDIAKVHQYLSSDHLLLAYYLHKDHLVIFAVTSHGLVTYEQPDSMAELEYLLPILHAHLQPDGWPDPQQPPQQVIRRLLKKLYDLLIAPVASVLPSPAGYLTIVPYGLLHRVPFHALYSGSHFIVEDFQVNYLPASSLLLHLANTSPMQRNEDRARKSPLVFGYSEKGHLQRVQDEAQSIASLLEANCYLEKEATIERLMQQASGCPVIHLATHGKSRLDAPNFSFVRLADGQLNALDAFRLNLKGCELVTLSGCETGLSLSGGGDEQLGLGRAFLAAGATSLVMSLWPVEDTATNILMKLFYQQLLEGKSKVEALRSTQCHLLRQSESAHPYFWAAFRLVGDGSPLKYRS